MGIELPQELAGVAAKAGVSWPEADEDAMKASAQAWRDAGAKISALAGNADSTARGALAASQGEAANAAGRYWGGFVQPDSGHLTVAARGCTDAADRLDHAADQVGAAKVEIVRNLVSLARNSDAAEQAAASGFPEALTALDTAVSGTAANVANIHSTLVSSVQPAAEATVANLPDVVGINPGGHGPAGLTDTLGQAGRDTTGAVSQVVQGGAETVDHLAQGAHQGVQDLRQGPGDATPGQLVRDTTTAVGQVAQGGTDTVAGVADHAGRTADHLAHGVHQGVQHLAQGAPGLPIAEGSVPGGHAGERGLPGLPDPERTGPLPIGGGGPGAHPPPGGIGAPGEAGPFPRFEDAPTPRSGVPLGGIAAPPPTHTVVSSASGLLDVPPPGQSAPAAGPGPVPGAAGPVQNPVPGGPITGGPVAGGPVPGGPVPGAPVAGAGPTVGHQPTHAGPGTNLPPQRVPERAAPVVFPPDQRQAGATPDRRIPDAPAASAPPPQAAVPAAQKTDREKFVALFLMRMFPIGHLPVASSKPTRQLPPPAAEFDYAAGIRFEPHDHPESEVIDGGDAVRAALTGRQPVEAAAGRTVDDPAVRALATEHDPLGGQHERDWDRRFVVRQGTEHGGAEYAWPPAEAYPEGGSAPGEPELLPEGAVIDRFGSPEGRVFADVDTAFAARSLPPAHLDAGYRRYRVLRPLPAWRAMSAAWFAQPGGGIRWRTVYPATDLVALGYLAEITAESIEDTENATEGERS